LPAPAARSAATVPTPRSSTSADRPNDVQLNQLRFSPYALIKFDRLTLRNGRSLSLNSGDFAQPPYLGQSDYAGHITLVKTHITGFSGGGDNEGAGVSFILHNGNFTMIDVLFDHVGGSGSCAIAILPWDDDYTRLDHVTMALSATATCASTTRPRAATRCTRSTTRSSGRRMEALRRSAD
jgi:hypothetical protein